MAQPEPLNKAYGPVTLAMRTVLHHVKAHVGVGIVCAVAYFDPGNWSVDLQAGAAYGYRPMLFVVLIAGLGAIVLQALAHKLGCVTGIDLASQCRFMLYNHPKHPKLVRRGVLYPLYALAEIAILSTDLAELLGSAIGFCLIFPRLPLWAGVVITAADVFVFLLFTDPTRRSPARVFEMFIVVLVFAVFGCFVALLVKVHPDWPHVFLGYIPSKTLFQSQPNAIYSAVGILGATIMPHAILLGSFLATQDRVSLAPAPLVLPTSHQRQTLRARIKAFFSSITRAERLAESRQYRNKYGDRENNSITFIHQHLRHGIVDVVTSLLFIAVPINSAILIVAAAVFFGKTRDASAVAAGLFEAHELIMAHIGKGAGMLFAISLICAGQTSGITATLAGQLVSEGFLEWKISPFLRRLITRLITLVPSVIVAVSVGRDGINTLLVASQVVLSIVLPFIAFPLIYLTSSSTVMRVRKPRPSPSPIASRQTVESHELPDEPCGILSTSESSAAGQKPMGEKNETVTSSLVNETDGFIDFSNGRILTTISYIIGITVLVANVYAITMLAQGKTMIQSEMEDD